MNKNLLCLVETIGVASILGSAMPQCSVLAVGEKTFDGTTNFIKTLFDKKIEDDYDFYNNFVNFFVRFDLGVVRSVFSFFSLIKYWITSKESNSLSFIKLSDDFKVGDFFNTHYDNYEKKYRCGFTRRNKSQDIFLARRACYAVESYLITSLRGEKDEVEKSQKFDNFKKWFKFFLDNYESLFSSFFCVRLLASKIDQTAFEDISIGKDGCVVCWSLFKGKGYFQLEAVKGENGKTIEWKAICNPIAYNNFTKSLEGETIHMQLRFILWVLRNTEKKLEQAGNSELLNIFKLKFDDTIEQLNDLVRNSKTSSEKCIEVAKVDGIYLNESTMKNGGFFDSAGLKDDNKILEFNVSNLIIELPKEVHVSEVNLKEIDCKEESVSISPSKVDKEKLVMPFFDDIPECEEQTKINLNKNTKRNRDHSDVNLNENNKIPKLDSLGLFDFMPREKHIFNFNLERATGQDESVHSLFQGEVGKLRMPIFSKDGPAFELQTKTTNESKYNENLPKITLNPFSSVQQQAAGIKNA